MASLLLLSQHPVLLCLLCCKVGQYVVLPAPLAMCKRRLHLWDCLGLRQRLRLLVQTRSAPELRHIHPILEACALHGAASAAEKLIKQMTTPQMPSPDGHCMECLARVCAAAVAAIEYQGYTTVENGVSHAHIPHCCAADTFLSLIFETAATV